MRHYDYQIAGSGLFGLVLVYKDKGQGRICLPNDRSLHFGGNLTARSSLTRLWRSTSVPFCSGEMQGTRFFNHGQASKYRFIEPVIQEKTS